MRERGCSMMIMMNCPFIRTRSLVIALSLSHSIGLLLFRKPPLLYYYHHPRISLNTHIHMYRYIRPLQALCIDIWIFPSNRGSTDEEVHNPSRRPPTTTHPNYVLFFFLSPCSARLFALNSSSHLPLLSCFNLSLSSRTYTHSRSHNACLPPPLPLLIVTFHSFLFISFQKKNERTEEGNWAGERRREESKRIAKVQYNFPDISICFNLLILVCAESTRSLPLPFRATLLQ